MKRTDIERILKQGSVRQKIKLYLTDIALLNVDVNNLDFEIKNKELKIKGTILMSAQERDLLWSSIKEPKDIAYYENMVRLNSAFLFYKERFSLDLMRLTAILFKIQVSYNEEGEREKSIELVNELLDLYPDKASREKALKKAIELTKGDGGKIYQEKGYPKYLDMHKVFYWQEIKRYTEIAIDTAQMCKNYIYSFNKILSKDLPLKPYKDWVKAQEDRLKLHITAIHEITVQEDTPKDFPKIELYEYIETDVTDEDIEDFKNVTL